MTDPSALDIVLVSLDNYVNAYNKTSYTFTIVPTVPIWEESLIFVTFPEQIKLPEVDEFLACSTVFESLFAMVSCSYDPSFEFGRTVKVALTFADGVVQIDPLDRFSITMKNIRNPTTTRTTDSIKVRITDKKGIYINSKESGIVVTTNNAHVIDDASVKAGSP